MALLIPVGFGQAVYEFSLVGDDQPMVVTCGHDLSNVEGGDYGTIANRLFIGFGADVMPKVSDSYTLTGVTLYVGQDGGPPAIYESTSAPVVGGDSANTLPQNCALLVRKRTSAAGRRGRGRLYLPGIDETQIDETGTLTALERDSYQAVFDAWMDTLMGVEAGAVAYPPVILHREEGLGVEPPPTPVTTFQVDNRIATQRRRLRR